MVEENEEEKHDFGAVIPTQNDEVQQQTVQKFLAISMAHEPEDLRQVFALVNDRLKKGNNSNMVEDQVSLAPKAKKIETDEEKFAKAKQA